MPAMGDVILHQFQFSHYNEKARWALDWKRVRHEKRSLLPGLHMAPMMRLSGQRHVPVLQDGERVVAGSDAIIAHLEAKHPEPALYPADPAQRARALELARWFDEELGPAIRRAFFHDLLPDTRGAAHLFTLGRDDLAARLFRAAFPLTRAIMRRDMRIDAAGADAGRRLTEEAFERVAREAGPGGYLVGDRFSVADLTAAALLSPAVMPPEFPLRIEQPPAALARWNERWRGHPGGGWVLEMYRRHR